MATIVSKAMPNLYEVNFQERPDPVTQWLDAGCPSGKRPRPTRSQLVWSLALICVVIAGFGMGNLYKEHMTRGVVHYAVDN